MILTIEPLKSSMQLGCIFFSIFYAVYLMLNTWMQSTLWSSRKKDDHWALSSYFGNSDTQISLLLILGILKIGEAFEHLKIVGGNIKY